MKLVLAIVFVLSSVSINAFAGNEHAHGPGHDMGKTFAERKAHMQTEIDQHMNAMATHKTCVSTAADDAALKVCHDKMHAMRMENRMGKMEVRKERMEKRMDKMKEKMESKTK